MEIVKSDPGTGIPIRDENGFCIHCDDDETGEAIAQIVDDDAKPGSRFDGYTSAEDTEKKVLRDGFRSGDAWFRTGDLMRRDRNGFVYFIDRIGDTFRWKGENVSTTEVSATICAFPGVIDATTYGVAIPQTDGKAGMAALVVNNDFDLVRFGKFLGTQLPHYARPLFVRIQNGLEMTSTFKHKKGSLTEAGYDPKLVSDPIYFCDLDRQTFVPLDAMLYAQIRDGGIRL
jgi:fatty-acyl-CoA synthase